MRVRLFHLGVLLVFIFMTVGCWIPLPEETAVVIKVLDDEGNPVDDVHLIVDSSTTLTTGLQGNTGQAFLSLTAAGLHTVQLDSSTLTDHQGGQSFVPVASQISGETEPTYFASRPFAGTGNSLIVPVEKGYITVATLFVSDILRSPKDNQWLTDGSNVSSYRNGDGSDEYQNVPVPVFWWMEDPSQGSTIDFTVQLWVDDDGDTRYPMGIIDSTGYLAAMSDTNAAYKAPDWQVPLAGIQRTEPAASTNRVDLWSSDITGGSIFDLYYAPTSLWHSTIWDKNQVLRNLQPGSNDGNSRKFTVGKGAPGVNSTVILKNGQEYTFALKARDASANLDTSGVTSVRFATPPGTVHTLTAPSNLQITGTTGGGTLTLSFVCDSAESESIRIYAAPTADFISRPYDPRFIRDTTVCSSSTTTHPLIGLVNDTSYVVGVESYDSNGNVGGMLTAVPGIPKNTGLADTLPPLWVTGGAITASSTVTPGQAVVSFDTAADQGGAVLPVIRRLYWAPTSFSTAAEAMSFTNLAASGITSMTFNDIPSNVPFSFLIQAIDSFGNASTLSQTSITLSEPDVTGPTWDSDSSAFFSSVKFSTGSTTVPLGWTYSWNGFDLDTSIGTAAAPTGEYVWRVGQHNASAGTINSKLGAFYTYNGYFYASTESSGLQMLSPSSTIGHREVFAYVESSISPLSTDVMGTPFDSSQSDNYRQKTAALYSASLASGAATTNQLVIRYNTDADGQAVVTPVGSNDFVGFLRVQVINKQSAPFGWSTHSLTQTKEIFTAYQDGTTDDLVSFPGALLDVFFFSNLVTPDYKDLVDSGL